MTAARRIQLQRVPGWRKPEGAVVVSRPSKWGNPFVYRDQSRGLVRYGPKHLERFGRAWDYDSRCALIKPGDAVSLWCIREWQANAAPGWACNVESVTPRAGSASKGQR